jgi:predicted RNA-binding protein (TIGR00451 family)
MSKHYLSKKEIKALIASLEEIGLSFAEADKMQVEESKNGNMYFLGRIFAGIWTDRFIPTPDFLNVVKPENKKIVVDQGAVPHILNGANLFAKGILSMSADISKDDYVFIADEHGKFLATAISTVDFDPEIRKHSGEAARTLKMSLF